jgi:hypothetical protein
LRQQVLDVGQHQLLMLLLVLHAQREQRRQLGALRGGQFAGQQAAMRASTSAR